MTTPAYGFPIKSRSEPSRRGWTRKDFTPEERLERARVEHKQACRKLLLAEQELEKARREAIESGRRVDALEDEFGEDEHASHVGAAI